MATTNHRATATPAPLASIPHTNGTSTHAHAQDDSLPNGHHVPVQEPRPAPTPTPTASNAAGKKGKGKKGVDQTEASKLITARISQLEIDNAAEREQEQEIGRFIMFNLYKFHLVVGDRVRLRRVRQSDITSTSLRGATIASSIVHATAHVKPQ